MSEKTVVTVPLVIEPQNDQLLKSNDTVVEDDAKRYDQPPSSRGNGDEGPTILGSEAPVALTAPLLRVEQLKPKGGNNLDSSFCTSEEEYGSHQEYSDDGDGDHSGNNSSSIPNLALDKDSLLEPPDEELQNKIISLVEFYFSNDSILKDAFLLKHVRRNRFGFVSIKLITSFKKMKSLTKDYRVVAYSLKNSKKLELNEECTKVRRQEPLPDYDETVPSRTVIALNLPFENPTLENISEIFSKCGCIANFRILRPGSSIPTDLVKFSSKHPELGATMCAVVAFETYDQAKKACEILNSNDWRKGMRVVPLMISRRKDDKERGDMKEKEKSSNRSIENDDDISGEEALADDKKRRRRGGRKKKSRVDELSHDSSCYSSGSEGDTPSRSYISGNKYRSGDHLSPNVHSRGGGHTSPKGSPHSRRKGYKSPLTNNSGLSPRSSPEMVRRGIDSSGGDSAPSSPWVQRRLRVAQEKITASRSPLGSPLLGRRNIDGSFVPGTTPRMLDMTNVLRQPKGPDDTKGFYGGLGRGKPRSSTIS